MAKKKTPGTVVDKRYKILKALGEGAMGVVYLAQDSRLDRPIALKLIDLGTGAEREDMEKRVLREAQVPAQLNHPGIVTIFDYGVENEYAFIAMEYVKGKTLWDIFIKKGRIPITTMAEINNRICEALAVAHSKQIVHRDIKPANIMILRNGQVKVMDFGLAKGTSGADLGLTKTGMLIGTPKYMSPEQIRGPSLDHRTDIYSMGVMLYELITGQSPFPTDNVYSLLSAVLNEPAPPASSKFAKLPKMMDRVLAKAIEKNPQKRYQAIDLFSRDFALVVEKASPQGRSTRIASKTSSSEQQAFPEIPNIEGADLLDSDLNLPEVEDLDKSPNPVKRKPVAKQPPSSKSGSVIKTQMLQQKWDKQQQKEQRFKEQLRENRCHYRMKNELSVSSFCSELVFAKSKKHFCFLHDPDIDKSMANVKKTLEERVKSKVNLEGIILRNVQLIEAKLAGAKFEYADLQNSELRDANLWEACLVKAKMQGARLEKANLTSSDLSEANFTKASLKAAKLKNAKLIKANFTRAFLNSTNLKEADMQHGNFQYADFTRADMQDAKLDRADLTGADLRNADLTGASLNGTNMTRCKFKGAVVLKTNLKEAILVEAGLERVDLSGAKLRESNLVGANLSDALLQRVEFWGANLSKSILVRAAMQNTDLGRANLQGANLTGANLRGANLRNANLRNANLEKADLSEADLLEADLTGAKLSQAKLDGTDCTGVKLDLNEFPIKNVPTWNKAIWDQDLKRELEVKSWGFD